MGYSTVQVVVFVSPGVLFRDRSYKIVNDCVSAIYVYIYWCTFYEHHSINHTEMLLFRKHCLSFLQWKLTSPDFFFLRDYYKMVNDCVNAVHVDFFFLHDYYKMVNDCVSAVHVEFFFLHDYYKMVNDCVSAVHVDLCFLHDYYKMVNDCVSAVHIYTSRCTFS